jgi:hypothetical protein
LIESVNDVQSGLQVTFDADSVFAFIDVTVSNTQRGFIAPNATVELLPAVFDNETTYGANTARAEQLFYSFTTLIYGNHRLQFYLSEDLTLFCSYNPAMNNTHACTRLKRPSCTYMNMFQHNRPNGYGYDDINIDKTVVLMALSYLGCVNGTAEAPLPPLDPNTNGTSETNTTSVGGGGGGGYSAWWRW